MHFLFDKSNIATNDKDSDFHTKSDESRLGTCSFISADPAADDLHMLG